MSKKIIVPILILSLFANFIFILKSNISNVDEKNFIGYFESKGSLNFNITRDEEIIIDDENNYIKAKITKITKNTFSFNLGNSNYLLFWNGESYILYISDKNQVIEIVKKSEKNIFNTNLKYDEFFNL